MHAAAAPLPLAVSSWVAALWVAAGLCGQQVQRTAHPQDSTQNSSGSVAPFGCQGPTAATEARTQILIRSQELPGPGAMLVGLELHCQNTLALDYTSLDIDAAPTTATSLSTAFATNLVLPMPLLRATNLHVVYNAMGWVPVALQFPYVHDGASALVLEVRKVVNPASAQFATMSTTSNPARADLPAMVFAVGGPGSGAAGAAAAQTFAPPLAVRLLWSGAPTLRLHSDLNANLHQFGLGGSIDHIVDGTPGSLAVSFVGTAFLSPPRIVPPVFGHWLVQGTTFGFGALPPSGEAQQVIPIPGSSSLSGLYLTWQSGTIDAVTGLPQFTNAVDNFIFL